MQRVELITRDDLISLAERQAIVEQRFKGYMQLKEIKIYTNGELAKLLKVCKRTLQNWRDKGIIKYSKVRGKIYYTQEAVERMMEENRRVDFRKINNG